MSGVGVIPRDFKPRRITVKSDAVRIVGGRRGEFAKSWEWESGVLYGRKLVGRPNRGAWARSLELSVAGRTEHFSDFGTTTKPKFGLSYRPNESLLLRSTLASSFRAPNLVQTTTTPLQCSGSTYNDVYRSEVTGLARDSNAVSVVFRQGNAALKPERARSLTAGIALSEPFYRGLTVTVDYWRIHQKDVISAVSGTTQLLRDEEYPDGAVQKALAAGKPIGRIDLGGGAGAYAGNAKIGRDAVTPADIAAFNAFNARRAPSTQRAAVGSLRSLVTDYVNLAGREVQGLDFDVELRLPRTRLGRGVVRGDASYLLQFDPRSDPGAPKINDINRDGRTLFRGNLGVTWRTGRWTGGWRATYYGPYVDTGTATTKEIYDVLRQPDHISTYVDSGGVRRYRYLVTSTITHDANLNYAFPKRECSVFNDLSLRIGVNNVFDAEPPIADADTGYQRGAGKNPRGRVFYAQATKRFRGRVGGRFARSQDFFTPGGRQRVELC